VSDTITLPGIASEDNDLINRLMKQLEDKEPRNTERTAFYHGKRVARFLSPVIPPIYQQLAVVLGWSGKAVDVLARRCNLDRFVWPDGTLDDIGYTEVWDDNNLESEISNAMLSSLLYGPSFLINTEGDPSEGEGEALIHVKDARQATGDWNARKRRMDNLLSITEVDKDANPIGLALYLDGRTVVAAKVRGAWTVVSDTEHPWGMPVEALVYKPRVGRPLGQSRISRPIMSIHAAALRTCLRAEGHADIYSFPEMWMLGANEDIFKNADGTVKQAWQVMLGRIKGIPDDEDATNPRADVKQFQASSPQPHIDQLKWQAQMFAGEASIPVTSLGVADSANPSSADAIVEARTELISEAEGATDDWRPPLRRSLVRALAMKNSEPNIPDEWRTIDTKFRNPIHLSRAAEADAGAKIVGALPWLAETEVGLELLGLDSQQIKRALAEKRKVAGTQALQAIQAAVAARNAPPAAPPTPAPAPGGPASVPVVSGGNATG
jgi:hypothetical protein